ncbi:hypothetical protein [Sphingobacterium wenxiniae]|uniref:Uncharacterized protein n=1 Tax=Sphingobacterium wenxiniae TaxID=683125 RepID=A0A1I6NT01_9SPHI|nr:hypothetical protein [Sphingobacterium wenxiniae]SFS30995.1 hypothetical protein SAMN05660206_10170 [Sphingobacterium wenxiniae]
MLWDVNGHAIEIIASDKREVRTVRWTEEEKILAVGADIPQQEVRYLIKEMLDKEQEKIEINSITYLEFFDKKWPLKIKYGKGKPYFKNNIIYCFTDRKSISPVFLGKIQTTLFQDVIYREVGCWEDLLQVLVPEILFRKNDSTPFIITKAGEKITFSKSLKNLSLESLAYAVFKAMVQYVDLSEDEEEKLLDKYFPNWNNHYKILCYEYPKYI